MKNTRLRSMVMGFLLVAVFCLLPSVVQAQCTTPGTICFPDEVDTLDALFGRQTNGPQTTLSVTMNVSQTSITVASAAAFGSSGSIKIGNEIIYYTGKTSNTFTGLIRGRDGTSAASHVGGSIVNSPILADHPRTLAKAIIAIETDIKESNYLKAGNNLSDVANVGTSRTNLGLGTMATQNANGVNISGGSIDGVNFGPTTFSGTVNVSGTLNATNLAGNCSGCTGVIAAGTGGTSSTGALGLISDSNNTGGADRRIDFIHGSGGSATTPLSLLEGNLGFGTTSPTAVIDVASLPSLAAVPVLRLRTGEAGSGDFSISYFSSAGSNGETRHDNQVSRGYNIPGVSGYVAGEHSFFESEEARFRTSEGTNQAEQYWQVMPGSEASGPWAISYRPFSMAMDLPTGAIITRFRSLDVNFSGYNDDNGWLSVISHSGVDGNDGDLIFTRNSGIAFSSNTRTDFLTRDGVRIIGGTSEDLYLGGGGLSSTPFVRLFKDVSLAAGTGEVGSLTFGGSNRSIRWNGNVGANRFEYTDIDLGSTTTNRRLNDWAPQIRYYGLTRAVGAAVGDYIEIGTISTASGFNEDGNFQIEIYNDGLRTYKFFNITKSDGDSSGTWREVIPSISGPAITDGGDVAVDIKNNGTGGHNLRIRRTVLTTHGSQTFTVALRIFDPGNAFIASSASGSSATAAGSIGGFRSRRRRTGRSSGTDRRCSLYRSERRTVAVLVFVV